MYLLLQKKEASVFVSIALGFILCTGCSPTPIDYWAGIDSDNNGGGDADTDSDADADTDSDTDADTDADGDADSDIDTDTDADADADSDADGDADGDSDTGECVEDAGPCDASGDADADSDADTDSDTDGDVDTSCGDFDCSLYATDAGYKFDNENAPYKGNAISPEAVVTVFSHFGCPHCQSASIVFRDLFDDPAYSDRTVYYFGQYPFGTDTDDERWQRHRAAHAAHLQGYFWEVHDVLFGEEFPVPQDRIRILVEGLGLLDMDAYDGDFAAAATVEYIQADKAEVQAALAPSSVGTPAVFVNGFKVSPWAKTQNVLNYLLGYVETDIDMDGGAE